MAKGIVKLANDEYVEWSTVVDAPVTKAWWREAMIFFGYSEAELDEADKRGHTFDPVNGSMEDFVKYNRAGPGERCATLAAMRKKFKPTQRQADEVRSRIEYANESRRINKANAEAWESGDAQRGLEKFYEEQEQRLREMEAKGMSPKASRLNPWTRRGEVWVNGQWVDEAAAPVSPWNPGGCLSPPPAGMTDEEMAGNVAAVIGSRRARRQAARRMDHGSDAPESAPEAPGAGGGGEGEPGGEDPNGLEGFGLEDDGDIEVPVEKYTYNPQPRPAWRRRGRTFGPQGQQEEEDK